MGPFVTVTLKSGSHCCPAILQDGPDYHLERMLLGGIGLGAGRVEPGAAFHRLGQLDGREIGTECREFTHTGQPM